MSIITRANLWGNDPCRHHPRTLAPATAQAVSQVDPDLLTAIRPLVQPLLDENARLVDQVHALTIEMGRLSERVRQLEAR